MLKLLGATFLAVTAIACGTKSGGATAGGGQAQPDSVAVSPGGGTTFSLVLNPAYTPGPGSVTTTAVTTDSVVVMGGQQCVTTVREILPATNPPKYRYVLTCR